MRLSPHLIDRLSLESALGRLESERGEFLPSTLGRRAARAAGGRYAQSLRARLIAGQTLDLAEIVFAHRYGSGSRPVADLDIDARLLLEALASNVAGRLKDDAEMLGLSEHLAAPAQGERIAFDERPLQDDDAKFIVKADVASFYEYVDHAVLTREILELTADVDVSYAVRDLLAEVMGRQHGLPQGPVGSDLLASLYLSAVDRRMLRAGVRLDRFNDDYLLRCTTLAEARQHLLALEIELRDVGLILNHQKTQIIGREKYEQGLAAFQDLLAEAAIESVQVPFGYSFDPEQFENISLESVDQGTIETAFARALDDEELSFDVRRRMVDGALPYLAKLGSVDPLQRLRDLIALFPAQIRNINLYLRSLIGGEHEVMAVATASGLLAGAGPWVQGWLVDFLARTDRHLPVTADWQARAVADPALPWFVRTRALIAVARAGRLPDQPEVAALFDAAPHANQPDVIAAVQLSARGWRDAFIGSVTASSPLLREVPAIVSNGVVAAIL